MALTKVTGQVIKNTTDVTVGVLTVTNTLAVGGTVSIGGTLTYEDVTNVDAVGLITARNGIVVGSGITLSKDGDIFFTGIMTGNGSGLTNLATDLVNDTSPQLGGALDTNDKNVDFNDSSGASVNRARFGDDADLSIYHDGSHSRIVDSGTGNLIVQTSKININNADGTEAIIHGTAGGAVELYHANSVKLTTYASGVFVPDSANLAAGAVQDLKLRHDGSHSYIQNDTGDLQLQAKAGYNCLKLVTSSNGGYPELYYDNSKKFQTTSTGASITGVLDLSSHLDMGDSDMIKLGDSDDLLIYHNGSLNLIDVYTNNLQIRNESSEKMAEFIRNGAVKLYHDNVLHLETHANGAQVRNEGGDAQFYISAANDYSAILNFLADNGDDYADYSRLFKSQSTGKFHIQNYAGGSYEDNIVCENNGAVELYHDNSRMVFTNPQGLTIYSGGSSQLKYYDVNTMTWVVYTNSINLRWYDAVNNDPVMELEQNGNLHIDGSYSTGGVDYAEYFESTDGSAIPVGTTVVLDNGKIRAATGSETPIGVIRPKTNGTSVTGGSYDFNWQGKYLIDDYDGHVLESAVHCTWTDANGDNQQCWKDKPPTGVTIPSDAEETTMERPKLNPLFDESKTYVPRSERTEWNCVGLLGQIPITKGQPTSSNWIKMKDRSATVELWMVK